MTNPPQPPAPDAAASGETDKEDLLRAYSQWIYDNDYKYERPDLLLDEAFEAATKDAAATIEQLIAAAVQAEKRRVLERLKEGIPPILRVNVNDRYIDGRNETIEFVCALLDSEQYKLGGE